MTSLPWWQPWLGLVGVVIGFSLSQVVEWHRRRTRRRAHWGALRSEIRLCRALAQTYSTAGYGAPLYRLPTMAYSQSLSALLGDGAVAEAEAFTLTEFFSEVATLNRGLDLAQAARDDRPTLEVEVGRNHLKAESIERLYAPALAIVNSHLPPLAP